MKMEMKMEDRLAPERRVFEMDHDDRDVVVAAKEIRKVTKFARGGEGILVGADDLHGPFVRNFVPHSVAREDEEFVFREKIILLQEWFSRHKGVHVKVSDRTRDGEEAIHTSCLMIPSVNQSKEEGKKRRGKGTSVFFNATTKLTDTFFFILIKGFVIMRETKGLSST